MEFAKKDNRIDLKSHAFILTIRNILRTNEANTEHWRIRNWIIERALWLRAYGRVATTYYSQKT